MHLVADYMRAYSCLPRRKEILDGMLGANLICFQTYSYSRHFTSCCVRVCGYESTPRGGIDVQGHVASIGWCPVGVDAERVKGDLTRPGIGPKLEALRALYEGKKIIVGRDKLDVVKGVVQKVKTAALNQSISADLLSLSFARLRSFSKITHSGWAMLCSSK